MPTFLRRRPTLVCGLFAVLLLCHTAAAQSITGNITGTVTDSTGGVLVGATVALVNRATNIESRATVGDGGYYTFVNVSPGAYVLRVEAAGFSTVQTSPFDVGVSQTLTQNVALSVGAVTQAVEVVAGGELIQASSTELGTVIPERAIADLPLNGRNFTQLLTLTPGVTPVSTSQNRNVGGVEGDVGIPGSGFSDPSFHGQQNRPKLYFYDGIINTNVRGPTYIVIPNLDLVQEFKVVGHDAKAEFGGASGGVMNMVSKSGGNRFHGSAFEFVRNDAFDARNSFDVCTPARCRPGQLVPDKPAPFRQNQFGASLTGPIFKNRTFFSVGYDGWRYSQPSLALSYVPTAAEINGDFTGTSASLCRQIFNPYSTRASGGTFVRDPFRCDAAGNPLPVDSQNRQSQSTGTPCNKIPPSLINPAMQAFFRTYAATPNFTNDPSNNFVQGREWARLARRAGQRYMVMTTKHHEGFCLFETKTTDFCAPRQGPGRDLVREYVEAARAEGLRVGFYYSLMDWHHPDGARCATDGATDEPARRRFVDYVHTHLRELLTNYGRVDILWYDVSWPLDAKGWESEKMNRMVFGLQPEIIVNNRNRLAGDFSTPEQRIEATEAGRAWESCMTMNDSWGYQRADDGWKSPRQVIRNLITCAHDGGNYLLNVGPTAEGRIPAPSVERLTQVGRWLKANRGSVYGTRPSPFPYELPWGIITTKPGRVYLHVFDWPRGELTLYGLKSKVRRAYLLSNRAALKFTRQSDAALGHEALTLKLPAAAPDTYDSVVALEVAGEPQVDTTLTQQPGGTVTLPAHLSEVHGGAAPGGGLRFDTRGVAERWTNKDEWLSWDFRVVRPGEYDVLVVTSEQKYWRDWEGGHELLVEAAGQSLRGKVERDGKEVDAANPYWPYVVSRLGRLRVGKAGRYGLALKPQALRSDKKLGLTLVSVRLVPAGQ